jgi:hypothetical protein
MTETSNELVFREQQISDTSSFFKKERKKENKRKAYSYAFSNKL